MGDLLGEEQTPARAVNGGLLVGVNAELPLPPNRRTPFRRMLYLQ